MYKVGDRVCLRRDLNITGTVVGFQGIAPRVVWDIETLDDLFAVRDGEPLTMPGSAILLLPPPQ